MTYNRLITMFVASSWVLSPALLGVSSPFAVGTSISLNGMCGTVLAQLGDLITIRMPITASWRRDQERFVKDARIKVGSGGMRYRDKRKLELKIAKLDLELRQAYREYVLSLKDHSWQVAFAVPPMEERAKPTMYQGIPWLTDTVATEKGMLMPFELELSAL